MASTISSYCFRVQPLTSMAFSGHSGTQMPHPVQRAGFTQASGPDPPAAVSVMAPSIGPDPGADPWPVQSSAWISRHKGVELHVAFDQQRGPLGGGGLGGGTGFTDIHGGLAGAGQQMPVFGDLHRPQFRVDFLQKRSTPTGSFIASTRSRDRAGLHAYRRAPPGRPPALNSSPKVSVSFTRMRRGKSLPAGPFHHRRCLGS